MMIYCMYLCSNYVPDKSFCTCRNSPCYAGHSFSAIVQIILTYSSIYNVNQCQFTFTYQALLIHDFHARAANRVGFLKKAYQHISFWHLIYFVITKASIHTTPKEIFAIHFNWPSIYSNDLSGS